MPDTLPLSTIQARPSTEIADRSTARSIALEIGGVLTALVLGLVALAHLVLSARSTVFFYSGDSVLMPLIHRSVAAGEPFVWAMSSVIFALPEIPVYLGIAAFVLSVHAALLVNALVILLGLYAILRGLASAATPRASRRTKVALALAPIAVLVLCSLLEHSAQRASLELVSLFLTTTYYYGTTLSLVAAIVLVIVAVTASSSRSRLAALIGLTALSIGAMFSNPLYAVWAAAPAALAVAILVRRESVLRRSALAVGVALVGGAGAGYLARIPFAKYISIEIAHYFRANLMAHSVGYYIDDFFTTAAGWQGALEMSLLTLAVTGTLVAAIVALVRRWPTRITLGLVTCAASILITGEVAIILGTSATRYLMPLFFAPAAATVLVGAYAVERIPEVTGLRLRVPARFAKPGRPVILRSLALGVAAVLALGVVSVRVVASAPSTQTYAAATCLANWIGGRDLTGAGRFWTIRALDAYGDSSVKILQITGTYNATLWLNDAADFQGQDVSYLVVDSKSHYVKSPTAELGAPAQTVTCGQYTILDYQGTQGETILTQRITDSALQKIAARHLQT